jgi:hypothetical protein
MIYLKKIQRNAHPPSFKTLFASILALFALSGIAWASVEFSSGKRDSPGDAGSPDFVSNYQSAHRENASLASDGNNTAPWSSGMANLWTLTDSAYRPAYPIHGIRWEAGDAPRGNHPAFFLNGDSLTGPDNAGDNVYNRVTIDPGNPPVGAANENPLLFNNDSSDSGGGGGGGGGGGIITNPNNPLPVISSGTTDAGNTSPIIGSGGGQAPMTPAPEPGTYVMLVIGFAMLGFITRLRKTHTFT